MIHSVSSHLNINTGIAVGNPASAKLAATLDIQPGNGEVTNSVSSLRPANANVAPIPCKPAGLKFIVALFARIKDILLQVYERMKQDLLEYPRDSSAVQTSSNGSAVRSTILMSFLISLW